MAALIRAGCHGWPTAHSFGRLSPCLLCGTERGGDALRHIPFCRVLRSCWAWLGIDAQKPMEGFLCCDTRMTDDNLALNALLIHAVYDACNDARHGKVTGCIDTKHIKYVMKQSAKLGPKTRSARDRKELDLSLPH